MLVLYLVIVLLIYLVGQEFYSRFILFFRFEEEQWRRKEEYQVYWTCLQSCVV